MGRPFAFIVLAGLGGSASLAACVVGYGGQAVEGPSDAAPPQGDGTSAPNDSDGPLTDAGSEGGATSDGPSCGGRGVGSPMVRVLDAGFCIDTTEVTLDQYAAFIAANPPFPPDCSWKVAYNPPAFLGDAAVG